MLRIQVVCSSLLIVEVREALSLPLVQKVIVHKLRGETVSKVRPHENLQPSLGQLAATVAK